MRRNLYSSLIAQWLAAAMSIISSILVARMMLPAELGVFTVAMAIIAILSTIQIAGTNEFLLYTADIDLQTRRSVFGLTILLTVLIAAAVVFAAPYVAQFYGHSGMEPVLKIAAINILVGTLIAPISAMLMRDQKFQVIAIITILSSIVLSVGQVLLVYLGYSFMGLAYAMLASAITSAVANFILGRQYMIWLPSFRGMRPILGFGSKMLAANIVQQMVNNSAQLLIGRLADTASAAIYGRANMLAQIYNQTIGRAVDPIINAQIAQEGRSGQTGRESLIASSRILIVLSIAFFGFAGIAAHLVVPLVFGPQWADAIDAMRILSVALVAMPLMAPTTAIVLAAARPGYLLRQRLINLISRVGLLLWLAPSGVTWAAAAVGISIYISLFQSLIAAHFIAGISVREYARAILPSAMIAMIPVAAAGLAMLLFQHLGISSWLQLIGGGCVLVVVWIAAIAIARHPIWTEILFLVRKLRPGGQ